MDSSDLFTMFMLLLIATPIFCLWFKGRNQKTGWFPRIVNWELKSGLHMARELGTEFRAGTISDKDACAKLEKYQQGSKTLGLHELLHLVCRYYYYAGPRR